jgi:hypothetical protein
MTKVDYYNLGDIHNASLTDPDFKSEVQMYYDSNPHNNGWAKFFEITDPKDDHLYCYILMNKYLIKEGATIGDSVLLHSSW